MASSSPLKTQQSIGKKGKCIIDQRIVLVGPYGVGKSSLLYRLKSGLEPPERLFAYRRDYEHLSINDLRIQCWDFNMIGRERTRVLLHSFLRTASGIVFVLDSSDHDKLHNELDSFINSILQVKETKGTVCMILANKQDLPNALTCEDIEKTFWDKYPQDKDPTILFKPCSVKTGEGLNDAFEEFVVLLQQKSAESHVTLQEQKQTDSSTGNCIKNFFKNPMSYFKSMLFY